MAPALVSLSSHFCLSCCLCSPATGLCPCFYKYHNSPPLSSAPLPSSSFSTPWFLPLHLWSCHFCLLLFHLLTPISLSSLVIFAAPPLFSDSRVLWWFHLELDDIAKNDKKRLVITINVTLLFLLNLKTDFCSWVKLVVLNSSTFYKSEVDQLCVIPLNCLHNAQALYQHILDFCFIAKIAENYIAIIIYMVLCPTPYSFQQDQQDYKHL